MMVKEMHDTTSSKEAMHMAMPRSGVTKYCEKSQAQRTAYALMLLFLICVTSTCFGQTVTIRIVNEANESAVKNQKLLISGISGNVSSPEKEQQRLLAKPPVPDLRLMTDDKGEAKFELPKPAPDHFYVRAELSGPRWDCTCLARVSTEDVIRKGLKFKSAYNEGSSTAQPKRGEILFALRSTPWWVQVFWPFLIDHRL
jgi:hypothetical protein